MATHSMTLRLPAEQARELEAVARVDAMSVSEAVRAAIASHIEARRGDSEFQARVRLVLDAERAVLERLAE